jgi:hypothetical protein
VLNPGETCPGPEAQPDVPGATDCPADTFCDAAAAGRCLQYQLSLVGMLGGRDIDVRASGSEPTTVECIREYVPAEAGEGGAEPPAPSGRSAGLKLVITGALAEAISPGAPSITVDVSNGDVLGGLPFLVLPRANAPAPRGDSVIASLVLDGTELEALGGQVTLDSVSGPDENGDGLMTTTQGPSAERSSSGSRRGSSSPARSWSAAAKTKACLFPTRRRTAERYRSHRAIERRRPLTVRLGV